MQHECFPGSTTNKIIKYVLFTELLHNDSPDAFKRIRCLTKHCVLLRDGIIFAGKRKKRYAKKGSRQ